MHNLELNIGKTIIPYTIVESARASRKRLVLTPSRMEVRVPRGTPALDISLFLNSKEQWIIQSWDELGSKIALNAFPMKFAPGCKIMKWGRLVRLELKSSEVREVIAHGSSPIVVEIPHCSSVNERESEIRDAIIQLLIEKLKEAIAPLIKKYANRLSTPKAWSISQSLDKWGYCSSNNNLGFHWQLACCPKSVLEYVVVHEMVHLTHRSHNENFWTLLRAVLPNYERQKKWLEIDGARIFDQPQLDKTYSFVII